MATGGLDLVSSVAPNGISLATHAPNVTQITKYPLANYQLIWTPEVVFRVTTIIVVMVFTLIGNSSLIIGIVCHEKLRRKRVNIFLVNLAIGDLMVCLVTMTTEILFVAFGEWVLGAAACKIIVYGQIVTLASATFLLTGMSIDRYQVIVQPFKSLTGQPKIWRKVITAWGLAFIFAVPQLFIFVQTNEGVYPDGRIKHMCKSKGYTAPWQRKVSFSLMTVYILIIPTIIMSFCYINIIKAVWMRTASQENRPPKFRFVSTVKSRDSNENSVTSHRTGSMEGNTLNIPPRLVSNSKRNVVKMTLSVIIGFVVCWTPYFVVSLIRIFSDYKIRLSQALSVTEIMALIHSALNPILYGMFNTHMARRACEHLCMKCCGRDTVVIRELNVSEEDSTYWSDPKQLPDLSLTRLSVVQQVTYHSPGSMSHTKGGILRAQLKAFFCCETQHLGAHTKPLLVYRRAPSNGHVIVQTGQYESFRMRAQSAGCDVTRLPRGTRGSYSCHDYQPSRPSRSSVQLELTTGCVRIKSVSESNIHKQPEAVYEYPVVAPPKVPAPGPSVDVTIETTPTEEDNDSDISLDSVVKTEVAEYFSEL